MVHISLTVRVLDYMYTILRETYYTAMRSELLYLVHIICDVVVLVHIMVALWYIHIFCVYILC